MTPVPTAINAKLQRIDPIKAVIFDVYGTLVTSGSGDVGSADQTTSDDKVASAMEACNVDISSENLKLGKRPTADQLRSLIQSANEQRRSDQCPAPEVDIVAIWRELLASSDLPHLAANAELTVRLATSYESRANPTWPMPGAAEVLQSLQSQSIALGIVSNAQVFTPKLVENLAEKSSLSNAGFDLDLAFFSNRFRQSKPGPRLFECLVKALARRGISPQESVYVGNDMLNDVYAAARAGLRTAWFAGDKRSLRPRQSDDRCKTLEPDIVLTNLIEMLDCFGAKT